MRTKLGFPGGIPLKEMPQGRGSGHRKSLHKTFGRGLLKVPSLPTPLPLLVYSLNSTHSVIQAWSPQKKEVAVWGMADGQELGQLR